MKSILHEWIPILGLIEPLRVCFIVGEEHLRSALDDHPPLSVVKLIERDCLGPRRSGNMPRFGHVIRIAPVPSITEPQRRQKMQARRLRPPIPGSDSNQDVFEGSLRVFNKNIEISVLVENARVNQFVFGIVTRPLLVLNAQLIVGKRRLRIFVEIFQIAVRGNRVEIVVILLHILAVIAFEIRQTEKPLLQNRVLLVPQSERKADVLMAVAKSGNAIFAPAVRARTCVIVREIVPRVAIRAVILAHSSPLALRKVWSPTFPVNFAIGAGL